MFVIPHDMHILACMSNITNCFAPKNDMSCCGLRVRMHAKKMNVTKPYFTIHEWSIKLTIKLSNSEKNKKIYKHVQNQRTGHQKYHTT